MFEITAYLLVHISTVAAAPATEPPMYADPYEAYKYEDARKSLRNSSTCRSNGSARVRFLQVGSQFHISRERSELQKYNLIGSALQPTAAEEVCDVLLSFSISPSTAPCIELKAEMLHRTATAEQTRIQQRL
ncbi:hypothetical protein HPB50_012034 [Hyalomma asiaticum]|uniref:Uncharacterized protein n=1 Tax=Hyalomma asiaticum TaxID=266040 RepID=A0ACB7RVT6_HYAAI|nr:hypothetical protein HPB50_012034 [Hyalomma asiaticum]